MKRLLLALALLSGPAAAKPPLIGHYRLAAGPDVAGALEIGADHRFRYFLAAGALDEQAAGRWIEHGSEVCLFTEPRPVPPTFTIAPGPLPSDQEATLLVTWPNGRGVALVDLTIGFDSGEPVTGYTQEYGWSMPPDEQRMPRWLELGLPMHGLKSPRLDLAGQARVHIVLTPNDLGRFDFQNACLEQRQDGVYLRRDGGEMRFVRASR